MPGGYWKFPNQAKLRQKKTKGIFRLLQNPHPTTILALTPKTPPIIINKTDPYPSIVHMPRKAKVLTSKEIQSILKVFNPPPETNIFLPQDSIQACAYLKSSPLNRDTCTPPEVAHEMYSKSPASKRKAPPTQTSPSTQNSANSSMPTRKPSTT